MIAYGHQFSGPHGLPKSDRKPMKSSTRSAARLAAEREAGIRSLDPSRIEQGEHEAWLGRALPVSILKNPSALTMTSAQLVALSNPVAQPTECSQLKFRWLADHSGDVYTCALTFNLGEY